MLTNETKSEIKNRLLEKFALKKIILFGSQARGTADNKSDIAFDIIAVTPEEYNRDKNIPGTIARYASKEGIIIYES